MGAPCALRAEATALSETRAHLFFLAAVLLAGSVLFPPGLSARPQADGEAAVGVAPDAVWLDRTAYAMGTLLRVRVAAADRPAAVAASEAALEAVRRTEDRLSTWRAGTELAALNAARPGRPVRLSPDVFRLLEEVAEWAHATGGAFDPAVGALVDAWDLRGAGRRPSESELERARAASGLGCFALEPGSATARRLCPRAWLDAGGFGKGAALREARRALESAGAWAAVLDFGGQQVAFGEAPILPSRTLAVAHPSRRGEPVLRLPWSSGSAATTGQSERGAETPEGRVGHVLDPRTGRPVPSWGSVTVLAEDPLTADVLSTALFVMGPEAGLAWAEGRGGIEALFLVDRGEEPTVLATRPMRARLAGRGPASAGAAATGAPGSGGGGR